MKLILSTPGLPSKERRAVEYHLERVMPQLKRRIGRYHTGTMILRARVTSDGSAGHPLYHVTLSTRLPDHTAVVQKDGDDLHEVTLEAEKALKKELRRTMAKVRKDHLHKKRHIEREAFATFSREIAPVVARLNGKAAHSPETNPIFARLRPLLSTLYNHAREQIHAAEVARELPGGFLAAEDLVDQSIISIIEDGMDTIKDPEKLERHLFSRIDSILHTECSRHTPENGASVSLNEQAPEDERWGFSGTEMEEREYYQPFSALLMEDVLVDDHAHDPEMQLSDIEQHRLILKMLSGFHSKARSAFFLNRVEGFELFEIAMIQNRDEDRVQDDIEKCIAALKVSLGNIHQHSGEGSKQVAAG